MASELTAEELEEICEWLEEKADEHSGTASRLTLDDHTCGGRGPSRAERRADEHADRARHYYDLAARVRALPARLAAARSAVLQAQSAILEGNVGGEAYSILDRALEALGDE